MCVFVYTFWHSLPPSVNFKISWNCLFQLFCTPVCVLNSLSHLCSVNSHQWKKSLNIPLYTSEASFIFYFLMGLFPSFHQQFTCVCCPIFLPKVFLFANGGQTLNFTFSQHCCVLHLLWYKQTQEIFSLLLLSLLSVVT